MKLFWCPQTRAVRAIWMLEELDVPYERVVIDIRDEKREERADFAEASPMGKVPALEDGEVRLAESAAVCLYLADRYSSGALAPRLDSSDRGRFLYWMFYTPAVIEPAMSERVSGSEANRFQNGWGDWQAMIETLEKGLGGGPWILGERFTAADVLVGSSTVFLRTFDMLPDSASLHAYADRCLERPAYQRATSLDQTS